MFSRRVVSGRRSARPALSETGVPRQFETRVAGDAAVPAVLPAAADELLFLPVFSDRAGLGRVPAGPRVRRLRSAPAFPAHRGIRHRDLAGPAGGPLSADDRMGLVSAGQGFAVAVSVLFRLGHICGKLPETGLGERDLEGMALHGCALESAGQCGHGAVREDLPDAPAALPVQLAADLFGGPAGMDPVPPERDAAVPCVLLCGGRGAQPGLCAFEPVSVLRVPSDLFRHPLSAAVLHLPRE